MGPILSEGSVPGPQYMLGLTVTTVALSPGPVWYVVFFFPFPFAFAVALQQASTHGASSSTKEASTHHAATPRRWDLLDNRKLETAITTLNCLCQNQKN
jgi:hypothetical protein